MQVHKSAVLSLETPRTNVPKPIEGLRETGSLEIVLDGDSEGIMSGHHVGHGQRPPSFRFYTTI